MWTWFFLHKERKVCTANKIRLRHPGPYNAHYVSVDKTIEANCRIMWYFLLQKLFFFAVFFFNITRNTTNDFKINNKTLAPGLLLWEERNPNLFLFLSKKSPGDEVESLILKNQSFLMILKPSVLNNINTKNRTRNKVANIARPESSSHRPLGAFF